MPKSARPFAPWRPVAFDEFTLLKGGSGADERDEMKSVDGPTLMLCVWRAKNSSLVRGLGFRRHRVIMAWSKSVPSGCMTYRLSAYR